MKVNFTIVIIKKEVFFHWFKNWVRRTINTLDEDKIGEEVKVIPRTNLEFSIDPVLSTGQYIFEVIFL